VWSCRFGQALPEWSKLPSVAVTVQNDDGKKRKRPANRGRRGPAPKKPRGRELVSAARAADVSQVSAALTHHVHWRSEQPGSHLLTSSLPYGQVDQESTALEGCQVFFADTNGYKWVQCAVLWHSCASLIIITCLCRKDDLAAMVKKLGGDTHAVFKEGSGITHILAGACAPCYTN
jgi:hypothetical protein